jgi:hypothetical protein
LQTFLTIDQGKSPRQFVLLYGIINPTIGGKAHTITERA